MTAVSSSSNRLLGELPWPSSFSQAKAASQLAHGTERSTQQALVVKSRGKYEVLPLPIPDLGHGEVMVQNCAVGLNHIDWMSSEYNFCLPTFPWITGREMSGVVVGVGTGVTYWKKGDRVWTGTYYRDRRAGCFQQLVVVPQHTIGRIPTGLTFEEAACLGVCALTAVMTLWKWLRVPMKGNHRGQVDHEYLLIWGGSTITGQFAVQVARQSGVRVIAVTSSKTKHLVQSLGAEMVITRDGKTNEELVSEIRSITANGITKAIDAVGPKTAAAALRALTLDSPALFAPLATLDKDTPIPKNVAVQRVEMKQFILDPSSQVYASELNRLIESGLVRIPEIQVMEGGLDGVEAGLNILRRGEMQGRKLVVSLA